MLTLALIDALPPLQRTKILHRADELMAADREVNYDVALCKALEEK